MLKRRRGSLTVEAVLILPIFMAAILFISYFIKAHLIQDIVQDALTEAVVEVSSMSYPYYLSGVSEFKSELYAEKAQRLEAVDNYFGEIINVIQSIQGTPSRANAAWSAEREALTPQGMFDLAKEYAALTAVESAENTITHRLVLVTMGNVLSAKDSNIITRMDALGIEGGLDGFDFSGSEFYGEGGMLDVQVKYRLNKVDPFGFIQGAALKNRVVCRAWMGGVDHDNDGGVGRVSVPPVKVGQDDKKDSDTVYRTCYVIADSKSSQKYHQYDCPNLRVRGDPTKRKTVVPVQVKFVWNGEGYSPEGVVVYEGNVYDYCGSCKANIIRMKD